MRKSLVAAILVALACLPNAQAQIVRLEILDREAPTFDGASFGPVGAYEKITGRLHGEVDPADPHNTIITDLNLAPRNARGRVEYVADFVLLKPVDMEDANGILRYLAPNRGRRISPVDSLFLAEGTVFLWGAWQGDVPEDPDRLQLDVPVATNPDGTSITGPVRVEFVGWPGAPQPAMPLQGNAYNNGQRPYPPAQRDNTGAVLTRRVKETDPRLFIPNSEWTFATCNTSDNPFPGTLGENSVCLKDGFTPGYFYELVYEAKDPKVMGLGLAAVRDMVAFFRHAESDTAGNPNPLGGQIRNAMGAGISQAGNFIKTFVHLGFNEDLNGDRVFDALFPLVAARQTNINMRFAVPGGGGGIRLDHRAFGQSSMRGFAADYEDTLRGKTGGVFARCAQTNTCPKTFLALSGSEMWALQGSPGLTDAYGTYDLPQPDNLRIYYFAGTQHGTAPISWNPALTVYPSGTQSTFDPIVRALWVRLTAWMVDGTAPPDSRVPRIADGTLVHPEELRYPAMRGVPSPVDGDTTRIPDFKYRGWYNALGLLDFGPRFEETDESGIADWRPPAYLGKDYAIMVSAVDEDGNEVAGIQPVGNAVPLGTNLPYNYNANLALGDLFWLSGAFIPFHETQAERVAAGDERRSLEERYGTHEGYLNAVREAVDRLVAEGFLLPEDAEVLIEEARQSNVLK